MSDTWRRGRFEISTARDRLDLNVIHDFLSRSSYWAVGRSRDLVARSIEHSLPFGLYLDDRLIGFARVVTDYATFAWLADVFVLEEFRGQGLSKWLVEVILNHPALSSLRRWVLATRDAHDLYRRFGFTELEQPTAWMERLDAHARGTLGAAAAGADAHEAEEPRH